MFFRWPSLGRIAHVGIVEKVNIDGSYVTIEGNTDIAGGRTGGRVMRQVRRANIAGFGRPVYLPPPVEPITEPLVIPKAPVPVKVPAPRFPGRVLKQGSRGLSVTAVQKALRITADGQFGPKTEAAVRHFQRTKALVVDGQVGAKTWRALFA